MNNILPVITALIGIVIGAVLTHYLERKRAQERLFFDARKTSYSKFVGSARYMTLKESTEDDFKEFYFIASESNLLASKLLREKLVDLINSIFKKKTYSLEGVSEIPIGYQREILDKLKNVENIMRDELGIKK